MPGSFTNYAESQMLNHTLGGVQWSTLPILYFSYTVSASGESGAGAEPSGGNFARVAVFNNLTNFPQAANGLKRVMTEIQTNIATANHGQAVDIVVWDAPAGGNALAYTQLPASKLVETNDGLLIPADAITIQAAAGGFFSTYLKNAWLDHIFGGVPWPVPSTWDIGYVTDTPTDSAAGTEPSTGNYGRLSIANNTIYFSLATGGQPKTNGQKLAWAEANGTQGTATHLVFWSGNNYCGRCQISPTKLIEATDIPEIDPGVLQITVD